MDLPVKNRNIAVRQVICVNTLVVMILFFMTIEGNDLKIVLWIFILTVVLGVYHILKNNLQKAQLIGTDIQILFNNKTIMVPISEIGSITPASSIDNLLKETFITTYFIRMKQKYSFGTTLKLEFSSEKLLADEPIEIKSIKGIIDSLSNFKK